MVGILISCALVGGIGPQATYSDANIDILARRYRIQAYYKFHDQRAELDRRLLTSRILDAELDGLGDNAQQQVALWFSDAIVRGEKGDAELPNFPVAGARIQLALEQLEQGWDSQEAFSYYLAATNRLDSSSSPEWYTHESPERTDGLGSSETVETADIVETETQLPASIEQKLNALQNGEWTPADTLHSSSQRSEDPTVSRSHTSDDDQVPAIQADDHPEGSGDNAHAESPPRRGSVFRSLGRIIVGRAVRNHPEPVPNVLPPEFMQSGPNASAELERNEWDGVGDDHERDIGAWAEEETDEEEESDEEFDEEENDEVG